jgi:glycosyltransferase involved in cell wall biosynthesis
MRFLIFGAYDPEYARNRVLRLGLRRLGARVDVCASSPSHSVLRRYPELLGRYLHSARSDAVLVPEFRHKDVPLARILTALSGASLLVDPLVSRYDTKVEDWASTPRGSLQADHNRRIDRAAVRFADLLLCDTPAHAAYFQERYRVPAERCTVVPVGFDDTLFRPLPQPPESPFRVAFFGSYLPLHGVDTIVQAAWLLRRERVRVLFVGGGQTFGCVREARDRGLELEVVPRLEPPELVRRLAHTHVLLGVFGTSPKAARVVPNKVYQGLALGRALVTGDTPGLRAFFEPGRHLLAVPMGDPEALAAAILRLRDEPELRRYLAAEGARYVHAEFNPEAVALRLLHAGKRMLGWKVEGA